MKNYELDSCIFATHERTPDFRLIVEIIEILIYFFIRKGLTFFGGG
jgi:hypothetical protein